MNADEFWKEFLEQSRLDKNLKYKDCFHFELSEEGCLPTFYRGL